MRQKAYDSYQLRKKINAAVSANPKFEHENINTLRGRNNKTTSPDRSYVHRTVHKSEFCSAYMHRFECTCKMISSRSQVRFDRGQGPNLC